MADGTAARDTQSWPEDRHIWAFLSCRESIDLAALIVRTEPMA
jgi:hypothetical protein